MTQLLPVLYSSADYVFQQNYCEFEKTAATFCIWLDDKHLCPGFSTKELQFYIAKITDLGRIYICTIVE